MVLAQAVLILPIVVSLTRSVVEDLWDEYEEQLRSLRLVAAPGGTDAALGRAIQPSDRGDGRVRAGER